MKAPSELPWSSMGECNSLTQWQTSENCATVGTITYLSDLGFQSIAEVGTTASSRKTEFPCRYTQKAAHCHWTGQCSVLGIEFKAEEPNH